MVRHATGRLNRRGASRLGCLVWFLILVAAGYFVVEVGSVYLRYYQFRDEMNTQAQFAPNLTDDTIRRRLIRKAQELSLPEEARQIVIRRSARPREILIRTSYEELIELPFITRTIQFNPEVRAAL